MKNFLKKFSLNLRFILDSTKGTTLVEVMIAGGLASMVSLAVMRINDLSTKGMKKIESDSSLRFYVDNKIRRTLSDSKSCAVSLGNTGLAGANSIFDIVSGPHVDGTDTGAPAGEDLLSIIRFDDKNDNDASNDVYEVVALEGVTPYAIDPTGRTSNWMRSWVVTEIGIAAFVPSTTGSAVGVCNLSVTLTRNEAAATDSTKRRTSFGGLIKKINLPLYCRLDTATNTYIENCMLASSTTEGVWAKKYADNKAYINYTDNLGGLVIIGDNVVDQTATELLPGAPLQVFIDTAFGNNWYNPAYFQGISNAKDSVYSFRDGDWGFTETGVDNSTSCLNFLAYYEDVVAPIDPSETAILPYVRFCRDQIYFRGGLNIQGQLGVNIAPSNLELKYGSLVLGAKSFPLETLDTPLSNSMSLGGDNSIEEANTTILGAGNSTKHTKGSLIMGTSNFQEQGIDSTDSDRWTYIIGSTNSAQRAKVTIIGTNNTVKTKETFILGGISYSQSTGSVLGNEGVYSIGTRNQFYTDLSANEDHSSFAIGSRNYGGTSTSNQINSFMIGRNNLTKHPYTMLLSSSPPAGDDLYFHPSEQEKEMAFFSHGGFRFTRSYDDSEPLSRYSDVFKIEKSGMINQGAVDTNFKYSSDNYIIEDISTKRDDICTDFPFVISCDGAVDFKTDTIVYNPGTHNSSGGGVIFSSMNSELFASSSAIMASYQSIIRDKTSSTDAESHVIIGSREVEVFGRDKYGAYSTSNSSLVAIDSTANSGRWSSAIMGGSGHKAYSFENSVMIGGSGNTATPPDSSEDKTESVNLILGTSNTAGDAGSGSLSGTVMMGGYNNTIKSTKLSMYSSLMISGSGNVMDGSNSSTMASGYLNKMEYCYHCVILGGSENAIDAKFDGSGDPISSNQVNILGGEHITFLGNNDNMTIFGSNVTVEEDVKGSVIFTDYDDKTNSNERPLSVDTDNRLYLRFSNGIYFHTSATSTTQGLFFGIGETDWASLSSEKSKDIIKVFSDDEFMQLFRQLPINRWSYIDIEDVDHMGPFAQDFYRLFGLSEKDTFVETADLSGVALRATQALANRTTASIKDQSLLDKILLKIKSYINKIGSEINSLTLLLNNEKNELDSLEEKLDQLEEKRD
jgi:hypothetical protein